MLKKLFLISVIGAVAGLVRVSLPDIKRYLEMRRM